MIGLDDDDVFRPAWCQACEEKQAAIERLRVALARICCEAHCNPHNIADAALGHPTAQEKWEIIKAAEAKGGEKCPA